MFGTVRRSLSWSQLYGALPRALQGRVFEVKAEVCLCGKWMMSVGVHAEFRVWICGYCFARREVRLLEVELGDDRRVVAETKPVDTKCAKCRKRESYVWCSKCSCALCALCSWTVSVPKPGRTGVVDERCRECASTGE